MLRLIPTVAFFTSVAVSLVASVSASAQSGARPGIAPSPTPIATATSSTSVAAPAVVPPAVAQPAAEPSEQAGGWLFRSGLLNIGKPEVTPPAIELNAQAVEEAVEQAAAEGKNRFLQPIYRMREAAVGAMERTRTAWNNRIESMKLSQEDVDSTPSRLARWFGAAEETPTTAPTAGAPVENLQQPDQVYRR